MKVGVQLESLSIDGSNGSLASETSLLSSKPRPRLGVPTAALFIAGELAGVGIIALPRAIEDTSWFGFILLPLLGATATYTAAILGRSWTIIEENYNEFSAGQHVQDPYPVLGEKSFGRSGRIIVQVCSAIAIFGGCVVFVLMSADLSHTILTEAGVVGFSPCYMVLIVGAVLIPLSWLGTPIDFWPMGIAALVSTGTACLLVSAYTIYIAYTEDIIDQVKHDAINPEGFFLAIGTIAFTFAGHPSFPTIQQDMKERSKFPLSAILAFTGVILMYFTITITTTVLLGNQVDHNVLATLSNLKPGWPITGAEILLLIHLITCYLVLLNPLTQALEGFFNLENRFSLGRVLIRTAVMLCIIFTAETVPRFGVILPLVGGTAITMVIIVLPVCMYESLCRQSGRDKDRLPVYRTVIHALILLVSVVVMVATTYGAFKQITDPDSFVPPCYVNSTVDL